ADQDRDPAAPPRPVDEHRPADLLALGLGPGAVQPTQPPRPEVVRAGLRPLRRRAVVRLLRRSTTARPTGPATVAKLNRPAIAVQACRPGNAIQPVRGGTDRLGPHRGGRLGLWWDADRSHVAYVSAAGPVAVTPPRSRNRRTVRAKRRQHMNRCT